MTRAEEFEQLRALLFAIAYRILGGCAGQRRQRSGERDEDQQRPRRRDGEGAAWIGWILTGAAAS